MNKKIKIKKFAYWIPVVIVMIMIFLFSASKGEQSASLSNNVTGDVVDTVNAVVTVYETTLERLSLIVKYDFLIRKLAHFSEYALLAITISIALLYGHKKNKWQVLIFSFVLSAAYAATDEFHQLFVGERGGRFTDVLIDSCGALAGILIFFLIVHIINGIHTKKLMKVNKKSGFTLVELIVVIGILAILVGVTVPAVYRYIGKSRESVCLANRDTLSSTCDKIIFDHIKKGEDINKISAEQILSEALARQGIENRDVCPIHGLITAEYKDENRMHINLTCSKHMGVDSYPWGSNVVTSYNIVIDLFKTMNQYSTNFNKELYNRNNQTFLKVEDKVLQKCFDTTGKNLYWHVHTPSINKKMEMVMFAGTDIVTGADNYHSIWRAYLLYVNGRMFKSPDINKYINIANLKNADNWDSYIDMLKNAGFTEVPK